MQGATIERGRGGMARGSEETPAFAEDRARSEPVVVGGARLADDDRR